MINKCRTAYSSVFDIYLIQLVEKVCIYICIYKNRANSLSLSPNPFPMGRGYITGATAPSPCRGLRPCDPIFKKYRFIDSLIYLIQRPCLFSVSAAFTQDIRKKHSCSEWKNRQEHRHQRFIYRSVAAVEHKQYSYADVAQTFTERQTYNHGCKEGYERIRWADGGKCVVTDISADYPCISEVVKLLHYISGHKRHGECP